eukprot:gnl/TRDRNA2_/TRDRNA2_172946_c1_seq3.p1 gnl/TRDRNA2_/TRDRNA2_172946_c1~~gnl/TRDRNA2_/TRDRNA2_172946_c1_seq3.p1  ORF type:complete len:222 (+),score=10.31 gnl/TRDRNA2_/TRDRNA2_172946_c1_seq3:156-821(+)
MLICQHQSRWRRMATVIILSVVTRAHDESAAKSSKSYNAGDGLAVDMLFSNCIGKLSGMVLTLLRKSPSTRVGHCCSCHGCDTCSSVSLAAAEGDSIGGRLEPSMIDLALAVPKARDASRRLFGPTTNRRRNPGREHRRRYEPDHITGLRRRSTSLTTTTSLPEDCCETCSELPARRTSLVNVIPAGILLGGVVAAFRSFKVLRGGSFFSTDTAEALLSAW